MKKVTIINQNKGGVGKSFLTALILEKEKKQNQQPFIIMDIDSGNRSTYKRFCENEEYASLVDEFSLLKGDAIDKGLFNTFFEDIAKSDIERFYLDLGGNESREFLTLLQTIGIENVLEFFKFSEITVEFITVVKCGDRDCIDHLKNVMSQIGSHFEHICMVNANSYDNESIDSYKALKALCLKSNVKFRTFGKCPGGLISETISAYVRSGFKTSLGMFRGVFVGMVENLELS